MIYTILEKDGFEGILFEGDGNKDRVLIVMSGSNGGMSMAKHEAEFYHKNGIPAMSLALFGTKQTSGDLSHVPVEYVEKAVQYLKGLGYQKIGIDGMSKGSEMALVAGSLISDITCVIARVPSYFVSEGLSGKGKKKGPSNTSCWSYKGKDLPYAAYKTRTINILKVFKENKELRIRDINSDKDVTPDTVIPVERINGPILFISSKHDEVWPSYESACLMEDRLNSQSFPHEHKHIAFENMSHAAIVHLPWVYKMAFKAERQHPDECAKDREIMKKEMLDWIKNVWH
jgi:dienelactone hydrolase